MKPRMKVAIVCAGYGLALVAAWAAGWAYDARVSQLPYDTSGGMYAEGQSLTGFAALFSVALPTTLLALWFLRRHQTFWQAIAVLSLGFASVGLVAVLSTLVSPGTPRYPALIALHLFGLAQLLGAPLWTVAFVLFAAIAPTRAARRLLLGAIGFELVIGVCAAIHWFVRSLLP
jgi:hypothetical protein